MSHSPTSNPFVSTLPRAERKQNFENVTITGGSRGIVGHLEAENITNNFYDSHGK